MSSSRHLATVLLVGSGSLAEDALLACAETLADFGLEMLRIAEEDVLLSAGPPVEWEGWLPKAVVVASPDGVLPGRWARATGSLTVRVPVPGDDRAGLDVLRNAEGQLLHDPDGGHFATMAIGAAGARNAALFVVAALALNDPNLHEKWAAFRASQTAAVLAGPALASEHGPASA